MMMKAIVKKRPEEGKEWYQGLDLAEVQEPEINASNQVSIKVLAAGICGTDLSIYKGAQAMRQSMSQLTVPQVVIGHEFVGTLDEMGQEARLIVAHQLLQRQFSDPAVIQFFTGKNATSLAEHEAFIPMLQEHFWATAEMHLVCGECWQCRHGEGHVCQRTVIKGLHADGAFATKVTVPAKNLQLIERKAIPMEIVAFMDAIGNATHTLQAIGQIEGKRLLVTGAGIQGLMAVAMAKAMGAESVVITDTSRPGDADAAEKLEQTKFAMAKKLGADAAVDVGQKGGHEKLRSNVAQLTEGSGVDGGIEMSGYYPAYADVFDNVRMGGTVALLGLPSGTLPFDFSRDIIFKGLTVKGVIGRRMFDTWDLMRKILEVGLGQKLKESGIVSHELPLDKYDEGFRALLAGDAFKVLLKP